MEVYSDIFQLGDGFIQTEGEPGGLHKANPIILGSFGGTRFGEPRARHGYRGGDFRRCLS